MAEPSQPVNMLSTERSYIGRHARRPPSATLYITPAYNVETHLVHDGRPRAIFDIEGEESAQMLSNALMTRPAALALIELVWVR
jgi:hypothetical protein